jgi:hypothetical protein
VSVYQKQNRKRTAVDWAVLLLVVVVAGFIIKLSFSNTTKLASGLSVNPFVLAGLIELAFAVLLFIRGRQRATKRNVPLFVHILYFASLGLVTISNMLGLYQEDKSTGLLIAVAISGFMWGMEELLVWLWTRSDEPHRKTPREKLREAKREIEEERIIQKIEWMKWEARKPDLSLIREARKAEQRRKRVIGDGLPEYFLQEPDPVPKLEAEPVVIVQETEKEETVEETAVIPMPMRQIGFHMEEPKPSPKPAPRFQPNMKARAEAMKKARALMEELGRIPTKGELMEQGLSEYYAKWAKGELKKQ